MAAVVVGKLNWVKQMNRIDELMNECSCCTQLASLNYTQTHTCDFVERPFHNKWKCFSPESFVLCSANFLISDIWVCLKSLGIKFKKTMQKNAVLKTQNFIHRL